LLYPSEEAYVDFLAINQKVRLKEMSMGELNTDNNKEEQEHLATIRTIIKSDRAIFDKVSVDIFCFK
jgi:hypothetical protein